MSQQIQASIPSPVSQAVAAPVAAPQVQSPGSYPQWVASQPTQVVTMPTATVAPQQQATPVTAPTTSYQSSQSQSSPSPSNPWEAAMGSLERVVSRITPQAQGSQYPSAPQAWDTQLSNPTSALQGLQFPTPSEVPTSYNSGFTTPNSYPTSTVAPSQTVQLSPETVKVVEHFGVEAPAILNQYSVTLEDALISQNETLEQIQLRSAAMEHILTDPDQLADYTDRFFTEVYPVDLNDAAGLGASQNVNPYQQQYNMPAVPAGAAASAPNTNPETQWNQFGAVMNRNPEQAWRYLSNMSPDAFRQKLLVMDNA